jgi:hypothetical protein
VVGPVACGAPPARIENSGSSDPPLLLSFSSPFPSPSHIDEELKKPEGLPAPPYRSRTYKIIVSRGSSQDPQFYSRAVLDFYHQYHLNNDSIIREIPIDSHLGHRSSDRTSHPFHLHPIIALQPVPVHTPSWTRSHPAPRVNGARRTASPVAHEPSPPPVQLLPDTILPTNTAHDVMPPLLAACHAHAPSHVRHPPWRWRTAASRLPPARGGPALHPLHLGCTTRAQELPTTSWAPCTSG